MDTIKRRLEQLEQRRIPVETVADMTDEHLIRLLTGGRSTEISDAELEQILREQALEVFDILAAAGVVEDVMSGVPPVAIDETLDELSTDNI